MSGFLSGLFKRRDKALKDRTFSHVGEVNNASYEWDALPPAQKDPNPQELLAAAHASCFTVKLGLLLNNAGYIPKQLHTSSTIILQEGNILESRLVVKADVPGITEKQLIGYAEKAKKECWISRALNMRVTVDVFIESVNESEILSGL
jgi:osmotically inducible protein OsmC